MLKRIPTFLLLTVTCITLLHAQQPDRTASKTISKDIVFAPADIFSITGEKAAITIHGWNKNYIGLKITFSAEHTDRSIAVRELEYMHYSLSREKHTVDLRNAFILPSRTDRLQSKLQVLIEIMVPPAIALSINNKYGNVAISDLSGKISAILEFSDLILNNVSGEVDIQSSYSEIRGDRLSLSSFKSYDEESRYILELNKGEYSFNSRHGDLDLTIAKISSLTINATHTDITIQPKEFASYSYQLLSKEGKIYVPIGFGHLVKKENNQSQVILSQKPVKPLIDVKTTFNTITIQ